jgi:phenylpropionate dioxygenase-like ring-hydroxylating dioxygenase large terminal subunit
MDVAGVPLILLRDRTGTLRAYANTCRHRGARLLSGTGNCRGIRCPFHSWAYKLTGVLAAAPNMEEAEGFQKDDYALIQYAAAERAGFAFVHFGQNPPDIGQHLGDFEKLHAGWGLDRLITTRSRTFEVECNWKAFLEVFNESYHLPFVHADSIANIYNPPDRPDPTTGSYISQFSSTNGTGALLETEQDKALPPIPGLNGRDAEGARYTWVFPNMAFAAGKDAIWMYMALPLGANRCQVTQTICFPQETIAHPDFEQRAEAYYKRLDAAIDEDIPALENQQKGLRSPHARQGRFSYSLEAAITLFARWYASRMLGQERQQSPSALAHVQGSGATL